MTAKAPRVSVILPVYNGEKFLSEAIESVLSQTYSNFELIVADDGSTDTTPKILKSYGRKIRVLSLPHKRTATARNKAIQASRGEFIALIDSDDIWEPTKLKKQVAYMDKHTEIGLCYTWSVNFASSDQKALSLPKKVEHEGWVFKSIFTKPGVANSSVMVRKTVIDDVGGYKKQFERMEDNEFNLRVSRKYKFGGVREVLVKRRIHPDSWYAYGYNNQYTYEYKIRRAYLQDKEVVKELEINPKAYLQNYVQKFIYKNLHDNRLEYVGQKLQDLGDHSTVRKHVVKILVKYKITSPRIWRRLIKDFDTWHDDVAHKAKLFEGETTT